MFCSCRTRDTGPAPGLTDYLKISQINGVSDTLRGSVNLDTQLDPGGLCKRPLLYVRRPKCPASCTAKPVRSKTRLFQKLPNRLNQDGFKRANPPGHRERVKRANETRHEPTRTNKPPRKSGRTRRSPPTERGRTTVHWAAQPTRADQTAPARAWRSSAAAG